MSCMQTGNFGSALYHEVAYVLHLARQVDREAAQMIVAAAEAGVIRIDEATALLMELSGHADKRRLLI